MRTWIFFFLLTGKTTRDWLNKKLNKSLYSATIKHHPVCTNHNALCKNASYLSKLQSLAHRCTRPTTTAYYDWTGAVHRTRAWVDRGNDGRSVGRRVRDDDDETHTLRRTISLYYRYWFRLTLAGDVGVCVFHRKQNERGHTITDRSLRCGRRYEKSNRRIIIVEKNKKINKYANWYDYT